MKKKKIIIPLIFVLIALAGIIGGAIMLLPSRETKPVQAAIVNVEDRIGGSDSRFTSSALFEIPDFYVNFPVTLRIRVIEYEMVMINFKATYIQVGNATVNVAFEIGTLDVILYDGRPSPGGVVTASRVAGNRLSVFYTRNDAAYSTQISDIWVVSYTMPDLQQDEVIVRFLSPVGNNLSFVVLNKNDRLSANQIPAYTDFIPSLYRHSGWRTKDGLWAHEIVITTDIEFYPVMEKNFEYGNRLNQNLSGYKEGEYNNNTFTRDFSNGVYKLPEDSSKQALADPFLIDYFSINGMEIPWTTNKTYFELTFNTNTSDWIPIQSQYNKGQKILKLVSEGTYMHLYYASVVIQEWKFTDIVAQPKNTSSKLPDNRITFALSVTSGRIQWSLRSNKLTTAATGILENRFAYQYDLNDNIYCLGLSDVRIIRSSTTEVHEWSKVYPLFPSYVGKKFDTFPDIDINGRYARVKKAVDCYIDGGYGFTTFLMLNTHEKPIEPEEIKAQLEAEEKSIEWYIDAAFTQQLVWGQHTARDYTALYGKKIPARYEVTLTYYAVERIFVTGHDGLYYRALVQKTDMRKYARGTKVNLNDYADDVYGVSFYNNIQQIPFQGWSEDINAPVMRDMVITASYKFPSATVYYYDVNDKLYGTVNENLTMFPVTELINKMHELDRDREGWYHEPGLDTGAFGAIGNFFDGILREIFGSDNVLNGWLAKSRKEQRDDTKLILDSIASHHNQNNLYFLPVLRTNVNLENLNKGAYGNAALDIKPSKNMQWHLIDQNIYSGDICYFADVHDMYSLTVSSYKMVINFEKEMSGFDAMAQTFANIAGWFGRFFGGIFGNFFSGLGGFFSSIVNWIWLIGIGLICWLFWPLIKSGLNVLGGLFINLGQALLTIIFFPFIWFGNWLSKKVGTS